MIDEDIDLTVDRVFSTRRLGIFNDGDITFKLRNRKTQSFYDSMVFKLSRIPWKLNEWSGDDYMRRENSDDYLSSQMGELVRSTSDNKIFTTHQTHRLQHYIQGFFAEEIAYNPFEAIYQCLQCGRKYIKAKNRSYSYGFCPRCMTENRIPWNGTMFRILED